MGGLVGTALVLGGPADGSAFGTEADRLAAGIPGISGAENGLRRDAGLGGNGLSADGLSRRYP
jgi:hypothetical protein